MRKKVSFYSCKFGVLNFYGYLTMVIYVHLNHSKLMIFLALYIEYFKGEWTV
jgi:hypothetical protein